MTNPVPQFPGKPAQTGAKPQEPWQNAICPFLTAGELARQGPPSSIVQLGPEKKQQVTAQACLGPRCMLFVSLKAPTGEVASGCAPAHAVQAQIGLNIMVAQFIEAAKAGAAAEAEEARRAAEGAAGTQPSTEQPAQQATEPTPTEPQKAS